MNHNETGVGVGWKLAQQQQQQMHSGDVAAVIERSDLFLQIMFVPWNTKEVVREGGGSLTTEEQVHSTIRQSLQNLQTTYIDAVLFHNFRQALYPYDGMIRMWCVLEDYVYKGTIRYLGISNVHDPTYFQRLQNDATIVPSIVQNRFNRNRGFGESMHAALDHERTIQKNSNDNTNHNTHGPLPLQVQRFWILTGNGGGK